MTAPLLPPTPFTYRQASVLGLPRPQLRAMVAEGRLRRVLHGVYLSADVPDSLEVRASAAALVTAPGCVLCDRTAAWLWGVDVLDYRDLEILPPLDVFVLSERPRVRRREARGGERDLSDDDVVRLHGVRVTTPLRTALDLGCRLGRRDALAALDGFMRVHGLTHAGLLAELPRFRGRRGVVQLRQLIPLADPRAESPSESWTRIAIIDDGLPAPEPQYWVVVGGHRLFRLDLAYPRSRVAVEYDGRQFHDSPQQRSHDEQRRRWLRDRGWTVIVVRRESFKGPALDAWLAELRVVLGGR